MYKLTSAFAAVAMTALLASSASAQLSNASFETDAGPVYGATDWNAFGNVFTEAVIPRTGVNTLKMFGNFSGQFNVSGAFQDFAIAEGESVSASVWAQNASFDALTGGNRALLKLVYFDAADNEIAASESNMIDANTQQDEFVLLTTSLGPATANTARASVFLLFLQEADNAGGAAFFDDASIAVVPEPATMTLLGAGLLALAARRKRK